MIFSVRVIRSTLQGWRHPFVLYNLIFPLPEPIWTYQLVVCVVWKIGGSFWEETKFYPLSPSRGCVLDNRRQKTDPQCLSLTFWRSGLQRKTYQHHKCRTSFILQMFTVAAMFRYESIKVFWRLPNCLLEIGMWANRWHRGTSHPSWMCRKRRPDM